MIEVIGRSPANIRVESEAAIGISIAKRPLLDAISTDRCNTRIKSSSWRFIGQGFPRPLVQFSRDRIEFGLGVDR